MALERSSNEEIAARLKALRAAEGIESQADMAAALQVEFNRYNHAECGRGLSKEIALRICQRFSGVTMDWLYFGRPDFLSIRLAKSLAELGALDVDSESAT